MSKEIRLEFYKLRRKYLFVMTGLFLSVELMWAFTATHMSFSRMPARMDWEPLFAMITSMNGLFLPILSAIVVSRIYDMEYRGGTWKLLLSLAVRKEAIYAAKFICANVIMLCACFFQALAVTVFGVFQGLSQPLPFDLLLSFVIGASLVNMATIALQQWVSSMVRNQAFALSVGLLGGFIGLVSNLFPTMVRKCLVWSYYSDLSPVSQIYDGSDLIFQARSLHELLGGAVILLVVGSSLYVAGSSLSAKLEV